MSGCSPLNQMHFYQRRHLDEADMETINGVSKYVMSRQRTSILLLGALFAVPILCLMPLFNLTTSIYATFLLFLIIVVPFAVLGLLYYLDWRRNRVDPQQCNIIYGTVISQEVRMSGRRGVIPQEHIYVELLIDDVDVTEKGELLGDHRIVDRSGHRRDAHNRAAIVWINANYAYIVSAV